LRRDGGPNLLTAAQVLTIADGRTWTLGNLAGLTAPDGNYLLSLTAAGSGIADAAGNHLATDADDAFTVTAPGTPPTPPGDVTGPVVLGVRPVVTRRRIASLVVTFNEP